MVAPPAVWIDVTRPVEVTRAVVPLESVRLVVVVRAVTRPLELEVCEVELEVWVVEPGECEVELVLWVVEPGECDVELVLWVVEPGECDVELVLWVVDPGECEVELVL